jgi:hypothetical protein
VRIVEYLFQRPGVTGPVFEQWGNVLLGAYLALILALLVLGGLMRLFSAGHALHARITRRVVSYGLLLQLAGLLVLWLRWLNWPVISMRLLLFVQLAAEVAAAGYLWYWFQSKYPDLLADYQWEERKRAYLPRAAGGTAPPVRRKAAARRR